MRAVCCRWRFILNVHNGPGLSLCAARLAARGIPVDSALGPFHTLSQVWFLLRISIWPPLPARDLRASLYRSAQNRISFGCVLHVRLEVPLDEPKDRLLVVLVNSGVKKTVVHRVKSRWLGNGRMDLPECDCVNSRLRENGGWCAHMLILPLLCERLQRGFERVQLTPFPRPFIDETKVAQFRLVGVEYGVKQAERMLRGRLKQAAIDAGSFVGACGGASGGVGV